MYFAMILLQSQPDTTAVQQMALAMIAFIPILILVGLAVTLIPVWFICKKAGFSPWLSLLCVVPMGGIVLLYVLAFADWKVLPVAPIPWPPTQPPPPPYTPQA